MPVSYTHLAVLKKALDLRGLQICNAWFSTYFTRGQKEETIQKFIEHRDFLHALGAKVIGISEQGNSIQGTTLPIFDAKPVYTAAQWQAVTEGFEILGALAAEKGMRLGVHHHMGTGVQTEAEIDYLMEHTSENVGLLYDCGMFQMCIRDRPTAAELRGLWLRLCQSLPDRHS